MEQVFIQALSPFAPPKEVKEGFCANCGREFNAMDKELAQHVGGNDWCIHCYEQGLDYQDDLKK